MISIEECQCKSSKDMSQYVTGFSGSLLYPLREACMNMYKPDVSTHPPTNHHHGTVQRLSNSENRFCREPSLAVELDAISDTEVPLVGEKFEICVGSIFARATIIWVFPKIMVLPNHPFGNRVFHYKPSIFRYPYIWKHPYVSRFTNISCFVCCDGLPIVSFGTYGC